MLPPVTKRYTDHSTQTYFAFSFFCDGCGAVWKSEQYPYSLAAVPISSGAEADARRLLWKSEHDAAYERANVEALFHFGKCPSCGRRVCDRCFPEWSSKCKHCDSTHD